MSLKFKDFYKKILYLCLNLFYKLSTIIQVLINWTPTSEQLLAESESKLLKCKFRFNYHQIKINFFILKTVLKNKPDCYFVEIGPGFGSNSNKIWTLDFNVKNDTSSRPVYKRKSLINQSVKIKNRETPVVFVHGLAAGSAIWLLNFDQIFENGPRRVFAIDILGMFYN